MSEPDPPRLFPSQVCFVVDAVPTAVEECVNRYGWGPFERFTARIPEARYRDWSGTKVTEVALGMAGRVQVELIHVHEGRDCVAAYQASYGRGFQHLGIGCRSRETALDLLEGLGAHLHETNEYGGFRIAFVDVPTGPAMFELLQQTTKPTETRAGAGAGAEKEATESTPRARDALALDRATIVTEDLDAALSFYAAAFGWDDAAADVQTLRCGPRESRFRRFIGRAGTLELELLEPRKRGEDPYSRHLDRGEHGLVHAGGLRAEGVPIDGSLEYEWLEQGERFELVDWAGGDHALQIREQALRDGP